MKNQLCLSIVFLVCICFLNSASGQDTTKQVKNYKNTVRLNLTNPLIFGDRSIVLGYERVLPNHESFSVNFGQATLPKLINIVNTDSLEIDLTNKTKNKGFNISLDYRYYLKKENKYDAPHGLFLAPYLSYATMHRENTWTLNTSSFHGDVTSDFKFTVASVGAEMGYQFIFWKRVTLEIIFIGPGLASYNLKTKFDTTLDQEDEEALFQKINDFLSEKIPGYSLVIDDSEFTRTGSTNTTTLGFRYVVHAGYRF